MLSSACMTSFFRLLGNLTPSLFIAQQIQSVLLIAMIAYCGFIIPYPKMKPWFQWFYWINPLTQVFAVVIGAYSFRYCLSSLIINEISGNTFSCEDTAVPNGANYTNNTFRSCTSMSGTSTPGELEIIGDIYLQYVLCLDSRVTCQQEWIELLSAFDGIICDGCCMLLDLLHCLQLYRHRISGIHWRRLHQEGLQERKSA